MHQACKNAASQSAQSTTDVQHLKWLSVITQSTQEGSQHANMLYLQKVLFVQQLTNEHNAIIGITKFVQLITFHNDFDTVREWNAIANNECKCLELNVTVKT